MQRLIQSFPPFPVAFTTPVAFTIPLFEPAPTHDRFVTCTVCSCQFTSVAKAIPFCSCHPQHSKSTDHSNNSKPAHSVRPRLVLWNLRAKIARDFLRTLERRLLQQQILGTRSNSMLRLSAASDTSAVTGITCLVVSLTYLAASLTDTLYVPEFSSTPRPCFQRQSDVSHRLTLAVLVAPVHVHQLRDGRLTGGTFTCGLVWPSPSNRAPFQLHGKALFLM